VEVADLAQTIIVRRVFEYATRIVRSFSAGGSSVIDLQDIASPVTRRSGELEDLAPMGASCGSPARS